MSVRKSISKFETRSVVLVAALTLGTAGGVWAQSTAAPMADDKASSELFTKADANGDKQLTKDEAKSVPSLAAQFAKVDANADGMISAEEFMVAMGPVKK
jgi:Ca2+-binding EF-hand superfamily protein